MLETKSSVAKLLSTLALTVASASSWGQATLTINGRLTITPCTVSSEVVVFGRVPVIEFGPNGGMGSNYTQTVTLTIGGCELATLRSARLTFNGTTVPQFANGTGLALENVVGVARGIAITMTGDDAIHGTQGEAIRFNGSQAYPLDVGSGKNTYDFKASYTPIPGIAPRPGTADASVVVTLSYS